MQKTAARPWEWSPPASMNTIMAIWLRIPLLHRIVSKRLTLLSFTGRKSGHHYAIPVGYARKDDTVIILTKRFRSWWRNFQKAMPIDLWLEGKRRHGEAQALIDETTMMPLVVEMLTQHPDDAQFYGIQPLSGDNPDLTEVRQIAPKLVVVRIKLTA
ncbi:MAG: nitroreductase/quinone reductase family protein [Anaerolineae bacterium]